MIEQKKVTLRITFLYVVPKVFVSLSALNQVLLILLYARIWLLRRDATYTKHVINIIFLNAYEYTRIALYLYNLVILFSDYISIYSQKV